MSIYSCDKKYLPTPPKQNEFPEQQKILPLRFISDALKIQDKVYFFSSERSPPYCPARSGTWSLKVKTALHKKINKWHAMVMLLDYKTCSIVSSFLGAEKS